MNSKEIIERLGGVNAVAALCRVSAQAVSQWHGIDPDTSKERQIPAARMMFLRVIKPSAFKAPKAEVAT